MALSPEEQETVIVYSADSKIASITTTIPADMKMMSKCPEIYKVTNVIKQGKRTIGKEFECETRFITLRKKDKKKTNV